MVRDVVIVQRVIHDTVDYVYDILKDYRNTHPYILPSYYFDDVKIIQGYGILGSGSGGCGIDDDDDDVEHGSGMIRGDTKIRIQKSYTIPVLRRKYKLLLDVTEVYVPIDDDNYGISQHQQQRIIQEIDTTATNIIRYIVSPIQERQQQKTRDSFFTKHTMLDDEIVPISRPLSSSCCLVTIEIRMLHSLHICNIFEMLLKRYICHRMYQATLLQLEQFVMQKRKR